MKIEIKKFGDKLVSRPTGREAFLALESYQLKDLPADEPIEIDFDGVKALTPSWADEVVTKIAERFKNVTLLNAESMTVQATLKTLREYSDLKI
ncbi:MAG: DUF4325 domain-containing protein [Candidatus Moranbacteria bacterium CG23_combo_of_CG06-09_8_20_14_all_39_10]|nr:MAG: DUF4325 domain-containing protein [Candidatus Moranbacteria bacterium CG23_combo_of_CG06-09_8_20_14_all_39_10]